LPKIHKEKNVLILGSSFIGTETAACIVGTAASVLVSGFENVPFERVLGPEIGGVMQKLHEIQKVSFKMNTCAVEFLKDGNFVHTVLFQDKSIWKGDIIIIGAGTVNSTNFIKNTGSVKFGQDKSIIVDEYLRVGPPGLFASGDVARFPLPLLDGTLVKIEHWGYAQTMGSLAAKNMANTVQQPLKNIPFFWTQGYGKILKYAGHGIGVEKTIIDTFGKTEIFPGDPHFISYYFNAKGKLIAIASMKADPVVAHVAQLWSRNICLTLDEISGPAKSGTSFQFISQKMCEK